MQIHDEDFEDAPIAYSIDNAILMHRDAHFGGDFGIMLDYYRKGGRGVNKDFEIKRIQNLAETQKKTRQDLSPLMLSGAEAEKVAKARQAYKDLRSLCESKENKDSIPTLIASLILAEEEEVPAALQALAAQKGAAVPALIELLRSDDFYDSLFPGYGQAPELAAKCLGLIGDKRAIIALFEGIGEGDFFNENIVLDALRKIGQPAKDFLLKVLQGHPITNDNEQAAVALIHFKDDPEVSLACLKLLKEIDLKKNTPLATYLVLACEGLPQYHQEELIKLGEHPSTPTMIRQDIQTVAKNWKKAK